MRVAALVLRRTHAARAAQDERKWGCGYTHQLMVSSAALPRVRRTMGDEVALGDAVLRADVLDVSLDHGVHVAEGVHVVRVALLHFAQVVGGGDEIEAHEARVPAEAAVGLARECEGEARFGVGEQEGDGFEHRSADRLSAHDSAFAGDQEDHQRPEAEHDTQEGREVTQQPYGPAFAFHGCDYTRVWSPADLPNANPPYFSRKSLRLLEVRKRELLDRCGSHPTKWGVTLVAHSAVVIPAERSASRDPFVRCRGREMGPG